MLTVMPGGDLLELGPGSGLGSWIGLELVGVRLKRISNGAKVRARVRVRVPVRVRVRVRVPVSVTVRVRVRLEPYYPTPY